MKSITEVLDLQLLAGRSLDEVAVAQKQFSRYLEPTSAFPRLLSSAIGSGQTHLASRDGDAPSLQESAFGWRSVEGNDGRLWRPQGERVDWLEGADLYLNMEAAYGAAPRMATDGGGIEVSLRVLVRRLHERRYLVSTDDRRQTIFVRRNLEGRQRNVLHLSASVLSISSAEPDNPDNQDETNRHGIRGTHRTPRCRVPARTMSGGVRQLEVHMIEKNIVESSANVVSVGYVGFLRGMTPEEPSGGDQRCTTTGANLNPFQKAPLLPDISPDTNSALGSNDLASVRPGELKILRHMREANTDTHRPQ